MIRPEEIDYIEEIGDLNGNPVKMIRTKGGFFCLTGKEANSGKEIPLAAGSHPAIVKFELQKKYGKGFREHMSKSESTIQPFVIENTNYLNKDLIKKGYSLYSVISGSDVALVVSHYGDEVLKQEGMIKTESIELVPQISFSNLEKSKEAIKFEVSKSIIMALANTAKDLNKKNIEYPTAPSIIDADKVLNAKK